MFIKLNVNPRGLIAADCVFRAISLASGIGYSDVFWSLCNIASDMCRSPSEKLVYESYLKELGFIKKKMPKHRNNKRYTVGELAKELVELGERGTWL